MENEKLCCPKFDPALWDEKEIIFNNKLFVKDYVRAIMHIPLNIAQVLDQMQKRVEAANAATEMKDFMILSDETSAWKSAQMMPVTKEVPGMENIRLSGKFLTKVFEGPYKDAPVWYKEMQNYVKGKGFEVKKIYMYYTTCPKCAKVYGKNYVVVFAQV